MPKFGDVFRHYRCEVGQCAQIKIVGIKAIRPLTPRAFDLGAPKTGLDNANNRVRCVVWQRPNEFHGCIK